MVVLQPSYNDTGCYADSRCEFPDGCSRFEAAELCCIVRRYEHVAGESVRFGLNGVISDTRCAFNAYLALAESEHMVNLVEERKPQMVIRSVAKAELDKRFDGRQPARNTTRAGAGDFSDKDNGHAVGGANVLHFGAEHLRRLYGQSAQVWDCCTQPSAVERSAVNVQSGELAEPQPCSDSAPLYLKGLRLAESARKVAVYVLPRIDAGHAEEAEHLLDTRRGVTWFVR